MYYIISLILFLITAIISPCLAISGGTTVQSSRQYPFSVTLTNPILCGGSIISLNPPWILTAAHCIENFDIEKEDSSLAYGSRNFSQLSYARIKQVVSHPMFLSASQLKSQVYNLEGIELAPYDIALVQLTEPLKPNVHVNRIPLMEPPPPSTSNTSMLLKTDVLPFETIGMGYTGLREPHANLLQYAECNSSNTTPLRNNNFNQSIILSKSNAGLCHGDSGSPLLFKETDDKNYSLAGVLNRIMNAYDPDPKDLSCPVRESNVTGFTNVFVRASAHMKWITEITGLSQDQLTASVAPMDDASVISSSSFSAGASSYAYIRLGNSELIFISLVTLTSLFLPLFL